MTAPFELSRERRVDWPRVIANLQKSGMSLRQIAAALDIGAETVRAPGESPVEDRVTHGDDYPVSKWQQVASPVWTDIDPSDTLQYRSAREHDDERHICPLQLQVIRRGIDLWTNPGDVVASPFAGIGSEGVVAIEMGRKFVGAELKASYFGQAAQNLRDAESALSTPDLFDALPAIESEAA